MDIKLKSIKHFRTLSEETNAYTANIYIDGKRVGFVQSAGHGGCPEVRFADLNLHLKAAEYANTLPSPVDGLPMTLDMLLDQLIEQDLERLEAKRIAKIAQKEKARFDARGFACLQIEGLADGIKSYCWAAISKQVLEKDRTAAINAAIVRMVTKHSLTEIKATIL